MTTCNIKDCLPLIIAMIGLVVSMSAFVIVTEGTITQDDTYVVCGVLHSIENVHLNKFNVEFWIWEERKYNFQSDGKYETFEVNHTVVKDLEFHTRYYIKYSETTRLYGHKEIKILDMGKGSGKDVYPF